MSFFDDASLVMIPSGYKTSKVYSVKPTDGTGDLAFTRSNDTATRVGPDGLIEKVRTNVSFYSEQFDNGFWSKLGTGLTVTANTTIAPNGTLTADTLNVSNNDNVLYGSRATALAGNEFTFSIYVKGTGTFSMNIRLNSVTTTTETKTLTSAWQRFSVSVTNAVPVTAVEFYLNLNTSSTYSVWGAQVESGPVATPYIATTTAAVSVGPVANVPRLDYLGSSCPRLLLEPQRSNLFTFSEQINNAAWLNAGGTTTANTAVSPSGYQDADTLTGVRYQASFASNTYTFSAFAKKVDGDGTFTLRLDVPANKTAVFNLNNGTIVSTDAGYTSTITNYGNGWYRCTFTTPASTTLSNAVLVSANAGISSIFVYGCQLEVGAYATSYIPTLGASVTRGADSAVKASVTSLIGQTEGTIFMDAVIDALPVDSSLFGVEKAASNFAIRIFSDGSTLRAQSYNGAANLFLEATSYTIGTRVKVAFAYKAGSYAFYKNGTLVATGTNATAIPACDSIMTNSLWGTVGNGKYGTSQALLFTTRLTNAQLAELTA